MSCPTVRTEILLSNSQFWSAAHTLKTLAEKYYHNDTGTAWPVGLKSMLNDGKHFVSMFLKICLIIVSTADALGLTPSNDWELAIKSLGACVWYLTDSLLDIQIMEMSQFLEYHPQDLRIKPVEHKIKSDLSSNMVLDSSTLKNLRIVGDDLSLVSKLNHCVTAMGKRFENNFIRFQRITKFNFRLLHQWVCSPSCVVGIIKERQDAISFLLRNQSVAQDIRAILHRLPDMERVFVKWV
jgi:DNA mismatch repair protein MSH6